MTQLQTQIFTALGVGQQSQFKTGVTPTEFVKYLTSVTGGLSQEKTTVKMTGSGIGGNVTKTITAREWVEATFTGKLVADSVIMQKCLASLLGGGSGTNTVTGDADQGYTHTFQIVGNETDRLDLDKSLTLVKYHGDNTAQELCGCVIKDFKLTIPESEVVTYEFGLIGYGAQDISITPTFNHDQKPLFSPLMAKIEIGDLGTFANLEALPSYNTADISFNNGLFHTYGAGRIDNMGMNPLTASITTSTPYETSKKYLDYVKNNTRKSMVITIESTEKVSDDASAKNYSIKLKFPEVGFNESVNVDFALEDASELRQSLTIEPSTHTEGPNKYFMEIETVDATAGVF
jgi:hypothetical protein